MNFRIFFIIAILSFLTPFVGYAATLSVTPSSGTFSVGSIFDVSIILNTEGESVNAIVASLSFPPDMLQVVSPSTGQSVVGVWTANPKLDNKLGIIELQGGIPGGINASSALITTVTFRVKSTGNAVVRFRDSSKILRNDGLGTDILGQTLNGIFSFKLPPPGGPIVISDTHPDQNLWYQSSTVSLQFENPNPVEGYSYIFSDDPATIPDNISEGTKNSIAYANISDGVHYFHIKSLRGGLWGGVTHFSVKVDGTPPADFKIDISPDSRTAIRQPVIQFTTTDALSGMDHYDLKLVPLSGNIADIDDGESLFIEGISPYTPSPLPLGVYDVIIRAYDNSGNHREVIERLTITTPIFAFITKDGLKFGSFILEWIWVWIIGLLLLLALVATAFKVLKWKRQVHLLYEAKHLPQNVLSELEELQKYRQRYGKALVLILMVISALSFNTVDAQTARLAPPLITTISKNVSNEEIFYIGGKTDFADEKVVIHIQNLSTGETFSHESKSDKEGDWFYRHGSFLSPGQYLLWVQGQIGEELSPPSPQEKMIVNRTAVSFGGGKLSYETIYLFIIIFLFSGILALGIFIIFHLRHGRERHILLQREIKEAEESIRRGFALIKRDIEAELNLIKKAQLTAELSREEKEKEVQLMRDLENVEKRLGQEIWEISQEA